MKHRQRRKGNVLMYKVCEEKNRDVYFTRVDMCGFDELFLHISRPVKKRTAEVRCTSVSGKCNLHIFSTLGVIMYVFE